MLNNFDRIKPMLKFKEGFFYFVQILQRKKDHYKGQVNGANNNSRLIKAYYIDNAEYLDFVRPEIIQLCSVFNARAGINLNRRSYEMMAYQHLKKITDQILNKDFVNASRAYNSACGKFANETDKVWIIDIDEADRQMAISTMADVLHDCQPIGDKYIGHIPSKSGIHFLARPFNVQMFKEKYPDLDIHKNNPTNLYIP